MNLCRQRRDSLHSLLHSRHVENRTVRVFISSTFRDFRLERDYLMRHTLPHLKRFAESRGVSVLFVDLRWVGVRGPGQMHRA